MSKKSVYSVRCRRFDYTIIFIIKVLHFIVFVVISKEQIFVDILDANTWARPLSI